MGPLYPQHAIWTIGWLTKPSEERGKHVNSPAFESHKYLPRTGLPHYSFIILQSFQTNSDTLWVIINHSQCSAPAHLSSASSSLAYKTFKINSMQSLFLSVVLFWKQKRKESNFQRLVGVFFSPFPPSILQEKALRTHRVSSPEMSCGFNSASRKQMQWHIKCPHCHGRRHST